VFFTFGFLIPNSNDQTDQFFYFTTKHTKGRMEKRKMEKGEWKKENLRTLEL